MKVMWCWRCRQNVPMLDEEEYAIVSKLYAAAFDRRNFPPDQRLAIDERFKPVRDAYEHLTGLADCHQNAIMHHRIATYGPPCSSCGKPLRTPRASFCAACGEPMRSREG